MKKVKDTNAEYHSVKSLSSSALKTIYKTSVKHWLSVKVKPSKAMDFGTAVHTALLEPLKFKDDVAVKPDNIDRRTKAGKEAYAEFVEDAKGKAIIDNDQNNLIHEIIDVVQSKSYIDYYLHGQTELSHYGKFMDLDCRCRPDVINTGKNFITDIKTCQSTHPADFTRDVEKWRYDLQAAFYSDFCGIPAENFRFVIIMATMALQDDGSVKPYADAQLISLDKNLIERGRAAYKEAINKYKLYLKVGISDQITWPHVNDKDESYIIKGYGKY